MVVPRGLSEQRLVELIIERCRFFGQATNIRLMPALPDGRLVFVEMGNTKESHQVSRAMVEPCLDTGPPPFASPTSVNAVLRDVEKILPVLKAQATKH